MIHKFSTSQIYSIPRFFYYLGLLTIGQTIFRPLFSITVSDWFFLTSIILASFESLLRKKVEINLPLYMLLGLFLFTLGGAIASIYSEKPGESLFSLIKYLYLLAGWIWLSTILLKKYEHIENSVIFWTLSAAISGFGALTQSFGWDMALGVLPSWGRMTGFTEHVNDLGGLCSITFVPAIMLIFRHTKTITGFVFLWINLMLIVTGIFLSVSLSALVAATISFSVLIYFSNFSFKKSIIFTILVCLFISFTSIQNKYERISILSRINDISNEGLQIVTIKTRLDTYRVAWESIKKNPIVGVGLGPDIGKTETGYVVHNSFLSYWYESGLLGLLGMAFIIIGIFINSYKGISSMRMDKKRFLGISLFSSYFAFIVLGMAQPIYFKRFGWISAALLIALYSRDKILRKAYLPGTVRRGMFNQDGVKTIFTTCEKSGCKILNESKKF